MDAFLGLLVVAVLVAAASGAALGGTVAGQRQLDHWETITARDNQRTELGRRAAAVGRAAGWVATGAARAVRAAVGAIRSRRGGSASPAAAIKPGGPADASGTKDVPPVDPTPPGTSGGTFTYGGKTYASCKCGGNCNHGDDPEPGQHSGGPTPTPGPGSGPSPLPMITADYDTVDGQVVPNIPALGTAPTVPVQPDASAALDAAPTTTQEEPVSTDIATTGAAITYEQAVAATAACSQNAAALNSIANTTAGGIEAVIAALQGVGLRDDNVYSAFWNALEATRGALRAVEILNAAAVMANNALVAGHGTAAAVLAGNSTAATNAGFYTGGV